MSSCAPNKLNVIGVVVTFAPQIDPFSSLNEVLDSLYHLIVVDNCPNGHPLLSTLAMGEKITVIPNFNNGGLAGAYNAALSAIEAQHSAATHILYLDDDTDIASIRGFLQAENTQIFANDPAVAAVAPIYVERSTGLQCAPIMLDRFSYKMFPRTLNAPTDVSFLINSMSLWRVDAVKRIGRYSTKLAVDHIDTDYCIRAALLEYRLVIDATSSFQHSIGTRKSYSLFGKTLQSGGHSPSRRHMIARNTVLLAKRYGWRYPSFAFLCLLRLGYEVTGIVLAEDRSLPKVSATLKGAMLGILGRYR
jgi:rhamnosyltransferase